MSSASKSLAADLPLRPLEERLHEDDKHDSETLDTLLSQVNSHLILAKLFDIDEKTAWDLQDDIKSLLERRIPASHSGASGATDPAVLTYKEISRVLGKSMGLLKAALENLEEWSPQKREQLFNLFNSTLGRSVEENYQAETVTTEQLSDQVNKVATL